MKAKIAIKTSLTTACAVAAFCLALVAPSLCAAQTPVGGYSEISKTDAAAAAAAKFAVETKSKKNVALKLVSIESAKKQIVAGSNFKLCLVVNANDKRQEATVVVYRNLQNEFRLTSWTPGKCSTAASNSATNRAALAPDVVVKNLYAVRKGGNNPFFQNKSRARVDKYFAKDLADLIWKDISELKTGEIGALDFDPLINAQDEQITQFKIGKPEYGEGNLAVADVAVTFKNMGNAETVLFRLEQNAAKEWKISDVFYPTNNADASSLKQILSQ